MKTSSIFVPATEWIANPQLLKADAHATYAAVIEIDLADVKEPIVACSNASRALMPRARVRLS